MHTLIRCPACGAAVEVMLIVDEALLPAIPVRAAELPKRCDHAGLRFAAEDHAEVARDVDALAARVGQHMLYCLPGRAPTPARAPLTLSNVRRTMKQVFGDAAVIPVNGRIIHREVDK